MSGMRAVITGGSSRSGMAIARAFAARGMDLVLSYRRGEPSARALADELRELGGQVDVHHLELEDEQSIQRFAEVVGGQPVDALVHAAGSFDEQPWGDIDDQGLVAHYRSNASGPLLLTQALSDRLAASTHPGGACVILFGDIHAEQRPRAGAASYLLAKSATHGLVKLLAIELAPVRVLGIAPGVVSWPDDWTEARREAYLREVPLDRAGTPEDVARLAGALLEDATYVTGVMLPLDGGRHLR